MATTATSYDVGLYGNPRATHLTTSEDAREGLIQFSIVRTVIMSADMVFWQIIS